MPKLPGYVKGDSEIVAVFAHLHHPANRSTKDPVSKRAQIVPRPPPHVNPVRLLPRPDLARPVQPTPEQHRPHRFVEGDDPNDHGLHRQAEQR